MDDGQMTLDDTVHGRGNCSQCVSSAKCFHLS